MICLRQIWLHRVDWIAIHGEAVCAAEGRPRCCQDRSECGLQITDRGSGEFLQPALVTGYLKTTKKQLQGDGSWLCEISIPNREIASVYKSEIHSHLMQIGAMGQATANKIAESLYAPD